MAGLPGWAILIATPFMVVVVYAAYGVGKGLRIGLRTQVIKKLTGLEPKALPPEGGADT